MLDWLKSDRYKNVSRNLPDLVRQLNQKIVSTLDDIPRRVHIISRGGKKRK